jgi:excinuclease ABC subunit C
VKLTREPAPRLAAVTKVAADDAIYFGPFPSTRHVADTVTELCRALGIRDCPSSTPVFFADQLEIFMGSRSPRCLRGDLGTCLAPCAGLPDAATYRARVREAHRFLEGRGEAPIERLRERMAEAVTRRDFEYAALLRDRVARLTDFRERLGAWRGEMDALTLLYRVPGFRGEDRLYLLRRGRVREEMAYPKSAAARAQVMEMVEDVYGRSESSPRSLEREEAAEILFVAAWFKGRPRELRRTKTPKQWLEERRTTVSSPRGS